MAQRGTDEEDGPFGQGSEHGGSASTDYDRIVAPPAAQGDVHNHDRSRDRFHDNDNNHSGNSNDCVEKNSQPKRSTRLATLRQRVQSFTWANFTCTQSTGGIAILLSETPHQFRGLQTIGIIIFLFNLVLFIVFTALISARFTLPPPPQSSPSSRASAEGEEQDQPDTGDSNSPHEATVLTRLQNSLTTFPEAFFSGSYFLSLATFIICLHRFALPHVGGNWLAPTIHVLFWLYASATFLFTTCMFVSVFSRRPASRRLDPDTMNPALFLLIFNTMLTGTVAGSVAAGQIPERRVPMLVAGIAYQGLGWLVSLMLLPRFMGNLLVNGLGDVNLRPGLFMPVGSAGYTIVSLMSCAEAIPAGYGYFAKNPAAVEVLKVLALWTSVFMWLFTFWLFAIAFVANIATIFPVLGKGGRLRPRNRMSFALPWWAMIFPNVGFAIATIYIGKAFESEAINWVATAMTILLVMAWLMDLLLHLKSFLRGRFM